MRRTAASVKIEALPPPESGITVTAPAAPALRMYSVPFWVRSRKGPQHGRSYLMFRVPAVERGGILWLNPA
jgi:hypothetical protein